MPCANRKGTACAPRNIRATTPIRDYAAGPPDRDAPWRRQKGMHTSTRHRPSRRRGGLLKPARFGSVGALLFAATMWVPLGSEPTAAAWAGATLPPGSAAGSPALKPIDRAALQAAVAATARQLLVPGAVVLLRTPQGEFTVTYGTSMLGRATPPGTATHFRIASNTKTMTAAIIVQLAQEGKLGFSDPVSKYVVGVPNGGAITVADLLKMRSGLYDYSRDPELHASLDREPGRAWTSNEVLAIAYRHPPSFPPGTDFQYCNTNYVLLGLIAEKLDGKPLARDMHDRLFGPLGLKDTLLPASDSTALPNPYAHGYMYGDTAFALVDKSYPPDLQAAARAGTIKPNDYTFQNPSYASAAGGVISTARELASWIEALVGGRMFNAEYQRRWLDSPQPQDPKKPDGQGYGYGIGQFRVGPNRIYFHGGEIPGFNSFMGRDPLNKVTLVVWSNLTVSLDGQLTANTLMLRLLDQVYAASPPPPAAPPAAAPGCDAAACPDAGDISRLIDVGARRHLVLQRDGKRRP